MPNETPAQRSKGCGPLFLYDFKIQEWMLYIMYGLADNNSNPWWKFITTAPVSTAQ